MIVNILAITVLIAIIVIIAIFVIIAHIIVLINIDVAYACWRIRSRAIIVLIDVMSARWRIRSRANLHHRGEVGRSVAACTPATCTPGGCTIMCPCPLPHECIGGGFRNAIIMDIRLNAGRQTSVQVKDSSKPEH
jgi:hypothetical protein